MTENKNYTTGLPFTVDFRRMVEKTIKNRFHDENAYLEQLVKLGLVNGKTKIDIKNKKSTITVEFDTDAKLEEEEFKNVIFDLYGGNSEMLDSEDNFKLKNLGLTIAATLASNPKEIFIEVNGTNNNGLKMIIDKDLKPEITELTSPVKKTKITVVKNKEQITKNVMGGTKEILQTDLDEIVRKTSEKIGNGFIKVTGKLDPTIKEEILKFSQFSQTKITLNGKTINNGLTLKNSIFEKEYKLKDGTKVILSYPSNHFKKGTNTERKKTYFVRDNILVSTMSTRDLFDEKIGLMSTPNIILQSENIQSSMAQGGLNIDSIQEYKEELKEIIEEYSNEIFFKIDEENDFDWTKKSTFAGERLERSGLIPTLNNYGQNKPLQIAFKGGKKSKAAKQLLNSKVIKDTTGKEYTVKEFEKELMKSRRFIFTKKKNINEVKINELGIQTPVFIVPQINGHEYLNTVVKKIVDAQSRKHIDITTSSFDEMFSMRKEEIRNEKREKSLERVKKVGNVGKWTLSPIAVGVGAYEVAPFAFEMAQLAGNFLFIEHLKETGMVGAGIGGLYGTAKATPKVINGIVTLGEITGDKINQSKNKITNSKFIIEKKEEIAKKRLAKIDEENLKTDEILDRLNEDEQKYIKTLFGLLQDFSLKENSLLKIDYGKLKLKTKRHKDIGYYIDREKNNIALSVDCYSDKFRKKVEEFKNGNFGIMVNEIRRYASLTQKIKSNIETFVPDFEKQQKSLDTFLIEEMTRFNRTSLIEQYYKENSHFQTIFQNTSETERFQILKIMLNAQREEESPYEGWIFDNFEREIDLVTDHVISKADYSAVIGLFQSPNIMATDFETELYRRFFNMNYKEKLEVVESIKNYDLDKTEIQIMFEKEINALVPELIRKDSYLDHSSHSSLSIIRELRRNDEEEIDDESYPNFSINKYLEKNYDEPFRRRTLRAIGDLVPKRQAEINQILY